MKKPGNRIHHIHVTKRRTKCSPTTAWGWGCDCSTAHRGGLSGFSSQHAALVDGINHLIHSPAAR